MTSSSAVDNTIDFFAGRVARTTDSNQSLDAESFDNGLGVEIAVRRKNAFVYQLSAHLVRREAVDCACNRGGSLQIRRWPEYANRIELAKAFPQPSCQGRCLGMQKCEGCLQGRSRGRLPPLR